MFTSRRPFIVLIFWDEHVKEHIQCPVSTPPPSPLHIDMTCGDSGPLFFIYLLSVCEAQIKQHGLLCSFPLSSSSLALLFEHQEPLSSGCLNASCFFAVISSLKCVKVQNGLW